MEERITKIKQRINQIEAGYPQAFVYELGGGKSPSQDMPKEISQELEHLKARYKELNEQADKDVGIK